MNHRHAFRAALLAGATAATSGCGTPSTRSPAFENRMLPPQTASAARAGPIGGDIKQVRASVVMSAGPGVPEPAPPRAPTGAYERDRVAPDPLTLPEATALARRLQPRLRVFLEGVVQAQGAETVARAPFYPSMAAAYSVGGFDLRAGGAPVLVGPGTPNFTFLPTTGAIPVGLNLNTGYELAELRVQWLLADFGRRMGRYRQAEIGVSVTQLQTERAYQTVENDVALAYYQVLRTRSLRRIAQEGVRRAEDDLDVAKKLEKGGVIEKEKVLRAEVAVAQAKRALDTADAAAGVAVAGLNLAIGLNVSAPTEVVTPAEIPDFEQSLETCLAQAAAQRRELEVARLSIQSAELGGKVARAAFRPRVEGGGSLVNFQQSAPRANTDLAVGFIKLEWELFEGGRRVGEVRIADSKLRAAAAQAEAMADAIAFQVNESYRQLVAARRGIDLSKPAVEQAREAHRLLRARAAKGDATPAEVTEAETALTRAEQDYLNSTYDYLAALARLSFALGDSSGAPPPR